MRLSLIAIICLSTVAEAQAKFEEPPEAPVLSFTGPKPPQPPRRRRGMKSFLPKHQGLVDLTRWPEEPTAPSTIDPRRFRKALVTLCGDLRPKRSRLYAEWLLHYAAEFDVDPFTLAALIYRQSRCLPQTNTDYGIGLAQINPRLHQSQFFKRDYRYWVYDEGRWQQRKKNLARYSFHLANLKRSESSIYFAAAFLSIYKEQCKKNDGAYGSIAHRHHVSHVIWGDRVRGNGAEDRVLRARRRLLSYYQGEDTSRARSRFRGVDLYAPLDGAPRKVTGIMGDPRDEGQRAHRGIDFSSTYWEPVRAVADGKVVLAGVDRETKPALNIDPQEAAKFPAKEMGAGGLMVMIRHENGLLTAYMHLANYRVKRGDNVRAGQAIGTVGRTGVKNSAAHLHFEMRYNGKHIDPLPHVRPYTFAPHETYIGRRLAIEHRRIKRLHRRRLHKRRGLKVAGLKPKHP